MPRAPCRAVAKKNGQTVATDEVQTTGAPAAITLAPDRPSIEASGQDLSFIKVSVVDKEGRVCPQADAEISFTVNGSAAVLAGLDDGDPINHEAFQGTRHRVFHGLGLAVLQSRYDTPGAVTVTGLRPGPVARVDDGAGRRAGPGWTVVWERSTRRDFPQPCWSDPAPWSRRHGCAMVRWRLLLFTPNTDHS